MDIKKRFETFLEKIKFKDMELEDKVEALNEIRKGLWKVSPFKANPVECLQWIKMDDVEGNDYNPNKVPPPEMKLLYVSIREDGYTQPIVACHDKDLEKHIVVDGFHRNRVGKEYDDIKKRIHGYLPIVPLNKGINERMAATIRHNRARGTHQVQGMAEVVAELHLKGVSDKKIAEQLGMEKDEILRLKQFIGLGDLFKNRDFSKSWV
jgi:ParB-like chromosome segregation protein Spo0J